MRLSNGIFIAFVAMLMAMTGCDKWDCNGKLDGMWQLTEWRDVAGNVKATKEDMIFFSFQLQMASFQRQEKEMRTSLQVNSEEFRIYDPIIYNSTNSDDEVQPMSVLAPFGVPNDGVFKIQVLTGSAMVLKTNNQDVLTFRKY